MYKFLVSVLIFVRANSLFALLFVSIGFLASCEKEEETANEVRFNVVVEDDLGKIINDAKVYIFDNQFAYENARSSGVYSAAVDSGSSMPGGITFTLKGDQEYWILVKYTDFVRNFVLTNIGNGKIEKLEKNSALEVKLLISPLSGDATFWSTSANMFPITVKINGTTHTIAGQSTSAPITNGSTNAANFTMLAGTYNYQATSSNGCIWTNTVTITRGGFQAIELSPCIRGRISFTHSSYVQSYGDIRVVLDNNDELGIINNSGSYICGSGSVPGSSSGSFISVTRDKNLYTYLAESANGCEWVGAFEIKSDTCISINLTPCTP